MANTTPTTAQPKISQKMILRTAILLFILAALFFAYRYFYEQHGDFNLGDSNTVGMIGAIQEQSSGDEVVVIHPDGKIVGTSSWKPDVSDRDLAWQPDGKFLFFASDREDHTNSVYRWNPGQDDAQRRSEGRIARTALTFPADGPPDANNDMLMISGGMVQGFDPKTKQTPQLLPPSSGDIAKGTADPTQGQDALFQAMYGGLGTSFSYARWCKGNRYIAGILQTETGGETLILQDTHPTDGQFSRPTVIISGDHVQFDVNPKDGTVVFTVQGFRFPNAENIPKQFIKGNKVVYPYRNALGIADPDRKQAMLIGATQDNKIAFGSPSVSPDGTRVILTAGPYDQTTNSLKPTTLLTAPIQEGGLRLASPLVQGEVFEPTWSADGETIAFAMMKDGHRDIYTVTKSGSSLTNLTNGKGNFASPKFSPQLKASQ